MGGRGSIVSGTLTLGLLLAAAAPSLATPSPAPGGTATPASTPAPTAGRPAGTGAAPGPTGSPGTAGSPGTSGSPGTAAPGGPTSSLSPSPTPSPTEPPSAQDLAFLRLAHQDNLAEIRAGTAAEHRAISKAARNLGGRFVREHVSLDADLQRVATRLGVPMPTTPTLQRQRQLAEITAKNGPAFDQAWVDVVTEWNTQALADTQTQLRSGSLSDVKDLARDSLGVIRGHLSRLQKVPTDGPQVPTPAPLSADDYAASQSPLVVSVAVGMIALGLALLTLTARAALRAGASR